MAESTLHRQLGPGEPGLVSIIIPTYRRPEDLRSAVASALAQTYPHLEVIVVSDGPDPAASAAVEGMDSRVRYAELSTNQGPAAARNYGTLISRGEWLTFLDDDDLVLPEKIERQLSAARLAGPSKMIACRVIYRAGGKDSLHPERPLGPDEDVADYILLRPSLMRRPGVLTLQSLLIHRSLLEAVPFATHADHEDWAWLLEIWHLAGARIEFVWEPLVVYNIAVDTISRSRRTNWQDSLEWAQQYRQWISNRAFASFLSTKVALKAKRSGNPAAIKQIAKLVLASHPTWLELSFLLGISILPGFVLQMLWKRSIQNTQTPEGEPASCA